MNRAGTKVIKNASILMTSQLITWALSLLLTIFLPRYLGAAVLGEFAIASSIWAIMGMLIGLGIDTMLTKHIAREPDRTPQLVGMALILRMVFCIMGCIVVALYVRLMHYPTTTTYIIWITGISVIITQVAVTCQSALQGLEAMHYTSLAGIASKVINTLFGLVVIALNLGIYAISFVGVVATAVNALLLLMFLRRYYKPQFQRNAGMASTMIRSSIPYLISGLGLILYGQVDVLIISSLVNTQETGWYGAASQLFNTLLFIPVVFTTAVFPVLSRTYAATPDALPKVLRKTFDMLLLVSIPIGLGILIIAPQVVVILFGSGFTQSGPILALMGIVLIFTYQNVLIGQFLISTDRQNSWTLVMIIAAIITIPLDVILVPWCQREFGNGAIAGALSFIVTEFTMVVVGIWLLPKGSLGWPNVRNGAQIIFAGLAMVGAAWWFRDMFIAVPISIGAITYIGAIALLQVIPPEDITTFTQVAQALSRKLRRRGTKSVSITGA
jgi:O-antigen/teichoic acid export membrane protein